MSEQVGKRRLVSAREALNFCARAMDDPVPLTDATSADVRVIYSVAGQVVTASETSGLRIDNRLPVPVWLYNRYSQEADHGA